MVVIHVRAGGLARPFHAGRRGCGNLQTVQTKPRENLSQLCPACTKILPASGRCPEHNQGAVLLCMLARVTARKVAPPSRQQCPCNMLTRARARFLIHSSIWTVNHSPPSTNLQSSTIGSVHSSACGSTASIVSVNHQARQVWPFSSRQ